MMSSHSDGAGRRTDHGTRRVSRHELRWITLLPWTRRTFGVRASRLGRRRGCAKKARAAERFRREGSAPLLRAAPALFDYARAVNPGWPGGRERSADVEHHVKLKRCFPDPSFWRSPAIPTSQ